MASLIDFLFPKYCAYCGLVSKQYVCTECEQSLEIFEPECFVTREKSLDWHIKPSFKQNCPFEKVFYFYKYSPVIHDLVTSIKYGFHTDLIKEFERLLLQAHTFNKLERTDFDLITFVPISKKREQWRGFNQTKLFAEIVAKYFQLPFCQIVNKHKDTKAQIELNKEDRQQNIKNSFSIRSELPLEITNQRILLVDDICTTGSTITECAQTIKRKYPKAKIYGFCLARVE